MSFTSFGTWLLQSLANGLEADERDAVLGDLAEENTGLYAACISILGLLLRREVAKWSSVVPWLTLIAVVLPCVLLLTAVANNMADGSAIYLWLFVNNADALQVHQAAYWHGVGEFLPRFLFSGIALASSSWCSGYLIGCASKRTIRVNVMLACVLMFVTMRGWMPVVHPLITEQARSFIGNAAVFRNAFYRDVLPWMTCFVLTLLPLLRGVSDAAQQSDRLSDWRQTLSLAMSSALVLSLAAQLSQYMLHVPAMYVSILGLLAFCTVHLHPHTQQEQQITH